MPRPKAASARLCVMRPNGAKPANAGLTWLFVVVFVAVGCRDQASPKPTEQEPAGSATPGTTQHRPGIPALDQAFATEEPDKAWAEATEQAVRAVAPELTDITCRQQQCRATLHGATEHELVTKAEQLQSEDSLRNLDARGVVLTAPEKHDGKLAMKIYVKFDR